MARSDVDWLMVSESTPLMEVLRRHGGAAERGLPAGIALVVDEERRLIGAITDGDVRRTILKNNNLDVTASSSMTRDPIHFGSNLSFRKILESLPDELRRRGRKGGRFLEKIIITDAHRRPVRVLDYHQLWEQRVATHRHVVVLGMGYVGLTLGLGLAEEGFQVTGVDVDRAKVKGLSEGNSHVHEIGLPQLLREQLNRNFFVSHEVPADGDVFVIAVGTPVVAPPGGGAPRPNLESLRHSVEMVARKMSAGALVVLRSTVPAGVTRSVVVPMLEELTGMKGGLDFHVSFAPERTIEGKALQELRTLPQIIGGLTEDSVEATVALFRELTPTIVRVESLEAAEMVKLVNNSFRDLIFAFSNQIAMIASGFNLDPVELIRAANRGYLRDPVPLPSPGVGGPCLTKDPYIFAAVAEQVGVAQTLFTHGREVNEAMQPFIVNGVLAELRRLGKDPKECTVLVAGLAFKGEPETGDMRNSPSAEIAQLLRLEVRHVLGHDPVVSAADIQESGLEPVDLLEGAKRADVLMVLNNHRAFGRLEVFSLVRSLKAAPIIYDAWHVFRPDEVLRACPSVYMGLGFVRRSVPARES